MHAIPVWNSLHVKMELYRILWRVWCVLLLLLALIVCQLDVNSHAAFITGLEKVSSCPTTRQEWELAERKKNCGAQKIESNITLIYHCLLNHWRDTVYELCGERKVLIGHSCPEYNEKGGRIQENWSIKCNKTDHSCPFRWNSDDVIKYPCCTTLNKTAKPSLDTDGANLYMSALYVTAPLLTLLGFGFCIIVFVKTCLNKANELRTTTEVILPLVAPNGNNSRQDSLNN